MTPEQRDAVVEYAMTPEFIRNLYYCRLCSAITSSRETQESAGTHRKDCPKRAVLAAQGAAA